MIIEKITDEWNVFYFEYLKNTPVDLYNKDTQNKIFNQLNIKHKSIFCTNIPLFHNIVVLKNIIPCGTNIPLLSYCFSIYLNCKNSKLILNIVKQCKHNYINIEENPIYVLFNNMYIYITHFENDIIKSLHKRFFGNIALIFLTKYYKNSKISNNIINIWKQLLQKNLNKIIKIYEV